jgi:hypothetical protein
MGATIHKKIMALKGIAVLIAIFSIATPRAVASPENDRVYQLESLGWLKSSDNLDDIFSEFLDQEYTKYFEGQSRFVVKKLSGMKEILKQSDISYSKLIEKPEILKKIAQKFRVESLIRTRVYKESESYRFVLEWVYAPKGDVLSQFEFRFMDPGKENGLRGSELPTAIQNALDQLINKLPFIGQVTGVEGDNITVNLGRGQNIHKKEIFTIYTLQGLKRHPKLNTIEEWRWQPVGRAQVEQVEDSLSFAKVIESEPGQKVIRLQKVKEVLPAPPEPKKIVEKADEKDLPRLGWVAGNIGLAFYSREVGTGAVNSGRGGSGMGEMLEVEGLLWLNSRILTQLDISGALTKYNSTDLSTSTANGNSYSGSATNFKLGVGYALFPAKTIFDTIGWVHAGYKSTAYTLPSLLTDFTGSSSFGSFYIGIGGEVPYKDLLTFQLGFDLGLLKSAKNVFPSTYGEPASSSDLMFNFGAVYNWSEQFKLRMTFKINSQSMDFAAGESISQKVLSVGPSILYYF